MDNTGNRLVNNSSNTKQSNLLKNKNIPSPTLNMSDKDIVNITDINGLKEGVEYLILPSNKIKRVNLSELPRSIIYLDLGYNEIEEVTGEYPPGLQELYINNNTELKTLPVPFPDSLSVLQIYNTSLGEESYEAYRGRKDIKMIELKLRKTSINSSKLLNMSGWFSLELDHPDVTNVSKATLETIKQALIFNRDPEMCGELNESYILENIVNAKNIIQIYDNTTNKLTGFVILNIKPIDKFTGEYYFYIPIICSKLKGTGTIMITMIQKVMKDYKNIKYIQLSSVPGAIEFYIKKGFKACGLPVEACPMFNANPGTSGYLDFENSKVNVIIGGKYKSTRRKRARKSNRTPKAKYTKNK